MSAPLPWAPIAIPTPPEAVAHRVAVARAVGALIAYGAVPEDRAEGAFDAFALLNVEALAKFTAKLESELEKRRAQR